MRLKGQAAAPDVRGIVAHGRVLLGAGGARRVAGAPAQPRSRRALLGRARRARRRRAAGDARRTRRRAAARPPRALLAVPRLSQLLDVDRLRRGRGRHRRGRARGRARRDRALAGLVPARRHRRRGAHHGHLDARARRRRHRRAAAGARRRRAAAPPSHGRGERQGRAGGARDGARGAAPFALARRSDRGRRRGGRLRVAASCPTRRRDAVAGGARHRRAMRSRRCARSSTTSAPRAGAPIWRCADRAAPGAPRSCARRVAASAAAPRRARRLRCSASRARATPPARSCARRCCSTRRCCSKAPSRSAAGDEASARLRSALAASSRPLRLTSSGVDQPRLPPAARWSRARCASRRRISARRSGASSCPTSPPARSRRSTASASAPSCAAPRAARAARARPRRRRAGVTHVDVAGAVRAEFETDLGTVATKVDVSQTWEDLVVPDETGRTIAELVDQLRHRSTVLGRWGFQRKLGKGLGTTALFSGEPGTGKSMVAGLIAKRARPRALSNRFVARAFEMDWRDREEPGQGLRRRRDRPRGAALRRGRRAHRQAHHRRQERQRSICEYRNQLYLAAIGSVSRRGHLDVEPRVVDRSGAVAPPVVRAALSLPRRGAARRDLAPHAAGGAAGHRRHRLPGAGARASSSPAATSATSSCARPTSPPATARRRSA